MIDQATIQKIMDSAEIVDVVQDFISLKRRGTNYLGLCPFHNEKTPSFMVSPAKGIFKCFGCGKGGNAVNFVMAHESISYPEALKFLAKKYHIQVVDKEQTAEEVKQKNDTESMLIVSSFAQTYFSDYLWKNTRGMAVGLSYFRERGFTDEIIKRFELGFCPEGRDKFTQAALQSGYKLEYLEKTGLSIVKGINDYFDRFWGRVMFPIHAISGKVVAFGGRTLKTDKKSAKYLNSPESEIYHKSNILYGIFHAKRSIVQLDKCYMVEGYTDVISMHQAGIENVVASSGTSLTVNQIRLVKRFTHNMTILYDGDAAGIKASLRGIDLVLSEGMNVKVLLLPDGEDPDSFSKSMPPNDLIDYIQQNEEDFIRFKTRLLLNTEGNDPIKRAALITNIVSSISNIPSEIVRSVYVQECSNLLSVAEEVLYNEIGKIRLQADTKEFNNQQVQQKAEGTQAETSHLAIDSSSQKEFRSDFELYEREIIRILLNYATVEMKIEDEKYLTHPTVAEFIITELKHDEIEFENEYYHQIFNDFDLHLENKTVLDDKYFIHHNIEEISGITADLLTPRYIISKVWQRAENFVTIEEIDIDRNVPKIILEYKEKKIRHILKEIEQQMKLPENEENIMDLMKDYMNFKQISMAISKELGERTIVNP